MPTVFFIEVCFFQICVFLIIEENLKVAYEEKESVNFIHSTVFQMLTRKLSFKFSRHDIF